MTKDQLAANLAAARRTARLTQHQAAARLLCSARTVRRWEAARTAPTALDLADVARVYGTTVDALLTVPEQAAA